MLEDIRADLSAYEARSEKRLAVLHDRITHLTIAVLQLVKLGASAMSATTDAIKADLVSLDANVDKAIANAGYVAQEALAAEAADLADIRTHIEAIGAKVEGMVPTVAAAVSPAPAPAAGPTGGIDPELDHDPVS